MQRLIYEIVSDVENVLLRSFRDTLLRVTTDGGCKVSRQNYRRSFYDRSQGKANKRKSVIGNVASCYKLVKSVERKGITATPTNGESCTSSSRFKGRWSNVKFF